MNKKTDAFEELIFRTEFGFYTCLTLMMFDKDGNTIMTATFPPSSVIVIRERRCVDIETDHIHFTIPANNLVYDEENDSYDITVGDNKFSLLL